MPETKHPVAPRPFGRKAAMEFCTLSKGIIRYGNRGTSLYHFLGQTTRLVLEFAGASRLRILFLKNEHIFFCDAIHTDGEHAFAYRTTEESAATPSLAAMWQALNGLRPRKPYLLDNSALAAAGFPMLEDESCARTALLPFDVSPRLSGLWVLQLPQAGLLEERDLPFYESVAQTFGVALSDHEAQYALQERVKELACLFEIAQIVHISDITPDEIMYRIAAVLPPALQHPEAGQARIVLNEKSYTTAGYRPPFIELTSPIFQGGSERGFLEISYARPIPTSGDMLFLPEERKLVDTVARQISLMLDSRKAEEDRIVLQEQLRHADRLATLGQLSAGIAHELNEPLAGILGFAQLACKQSDLPGQTAADLDKIIKAALHAREVVRKLLLFSRQLPTKKTAVQLNQIVSEGIYFLESRLVRESIELQRRLDPTLPPIMADSSQLHQVLVNLVVNAVHAMPGGGKLVLETRRSDDAVQLIVSDTGCGMSEDVLRQIFIPFFTTKEVGQGTGLGLPVVHGIVTAHGGAIDVHTTIGQGSRFTVTLPIRTPDEEENHHE